MPKPEEEGGRRRGAEDKRYVEQKTVTWLAAGFIRKVGVQLHQRVADACFRF